MLTSEDGISLIDSDVLARFGISSGARESESPLQFKSGYSHQATKLNCLLLSTDIAFEMWIVNPAATAAVAQSMECVYRKKEDGVEMIEILH